MINIKMESKAIKIRDQLPEPVVYDSIYFKDGEDGITYTDCFEISLYRFLHLAFTKEGKIDSEHLVKYMDVESSQCQRLIAFYEVYSKVHREQVMYTSDEAFEERA